MQRRVVIYRGRVQGVGFRATARSIARRFAVTGRVRNEGDGSVRLAIQGEAAEVEAALAAIRERMARHINEETAHDAAAEPHELGFEIDR